MPEILERRILTAGSELRIDAPEDGPPTIAGYAAVFNKLSVDMWGFRERIRPGAFRKTLDADPDVRALFNHDSNWVLGRTRAATLSLNEDDHGLSVRITPPDTTAGHDVLESIKRGDVTGMSFAFWVHEEAWETVDGETVRELIHLGLDGGDVSPVTFPAYPDTEVGVRALTGANGLLNAKLARAIVRADKHLELTEDDFAVLRATIDVLAGFLPQTPTLDACRARLAEIEA